jgi:hypothetical protein
MHNTVVRPMNTSVRCPEGRAVGPETARRTFRASSPSTQAILAITRNRVEVPAGSRQDKFACVLLVSFSTRVANTGSESTDAPQERARLPSAVPHSFWPLTMELKRVGVRVERQPLGFPDRDEHPRVPAGLSSVRRNIGQHVVGGLRCERAP